MYDSDPSVHRWSWPESQAKKLQTKSHNNSSEQQFWECNKRMCTGQPCCLREKNSWCNKTNCHCWWTRIRTWVKDMIRVTFCGKCLLLQMKHTVHCQLEAHEKCRVSSHMKRVFCLCNVLLFHCRVIGICPSVVSLGNYTVVCSLTIFVIWIFLIRWSFAVFSVQ